MAAAIRAGLLMRRPSRGLYCQTPTMARAPARLTQAASTRGTICTGRSSAPAAPMPISTATMAMIALTRTAARVSARWWP